MLVALAIVGLLHLTHGTPVRRVPASGHEPAPAVAEPGFATTAALLARAWALPGHRGDVLTNGDGTFPRLWADLRAAERTITVQLYYAKPGPVADTLRDILTERARAGVDVRVLYDPSASGRIRGGMGRSHE